MKTHSGARRKSRLARFALLVAAVLVAVGYAVRAATRPSHPPADGMTMSPPKDEKGKILYWWDPMLGPSSIRDKPGKSAMNMDLVPVYASEKSAGAEVIIDPAVVQNMGVRTAPVTRGPLKVTVRAVGVFKEPEPGMHDVSLKVGGWIDQLQASQEGMHVMKGEALFALYSPALQVAEQELISAVRAGKALDTGATAETKQQADDLVSSAKRKLELWDVDPREIDAIAQADHPPRDIIFYSPATGHVEDKSIVQGSAIQPGQRLLRIVDHTHVWLDAEIYEDRIPLINKGQSVKAKVDAIPAKTFTGAIDFIYPHVNGMTRTLMARATYDTPEFLLKPGMYASVSILTEPAADALQVPADAVIDTGTKQFVFMDDGDGHFSPRTVQVGLRGDGRVQILDGLTAGENVVTSGQFLMDVESRTNEAIAKLRGNSP